MEAVVVSQSLSMDDLSTRCNLFVPFAKGTVCPIICNVSKTTIKMAYLPFSPLPKDRFAKAMCARVKAARVRTPYTQAEIAKALQVKLYAYRKYESRSPLPHYLIEAFCFITGATTDDLILGPRPPLGPCKSRPCASYGALTTSSPAISLAM